MQINLIPAIKTLPFKALPPRHYPYVLPKDSFESQAEEQMLDVREEMQKSISAYEQISALCGLKKAMEKAYPYMPAKTRYLQEILLENAQNKIDRALRKYPGEDFMRLILCSAQSAYQQDKHDTIYAFNLLTDSPDIDADDKNMLLYSMASVFKKLDRSHDKAEILKAEETLKEFYSQQPPVTRADLDDLYGNGKHLNFKA